MRCSCLLALLCCCAGPARAEIYKSIDAEGHVTYSSTPSRGAIKLGFGPSATPSHRPHGYSSSRPQRPRNYDSPSDFPRVDSKTQKSRDGMRHKILADELAAEEKLLAEARANLKRGEAGGDEWSLRALRDEVTLHERNISALRTEISSIR